MVTGIIDRVDFDQLLILLFTIPSREVNISLDLTIKLIPFAMELMQ